MDNTILVALITILGSALTFYLTKRHQIDVEWQHEKLNHYAVADKYKDTMEDIYKAKKKPLLSKKIALYLSKRFTGLTNREIGESFGIGHSAVSKAAMDISRLIIEDKRIKKGVEGMISHFEV